MAIEILEATAEASAASGNITLNAPSSPQTNDVWIAVVHSSDQVAHTLTDWTPIVQGNGGSTTSRLSVWYFRYAGSTPNLVVGHTAGQSPIGGILALRGCKTTGSPVNINSVVAGGTDASIEHTAITPTTARCLILACNGSADDNNRTPDGTYTPRFEDSAGSTQNCYLTTAGNPDGSVAVHTLLQTNAVNTGTITDTQAAADPWASVLIAIEPEPTIWTAESRIVGESTVIQIVTITITSATSVLVGSAVKEVVLNRQISSQCEIITQGLININFAIDIGISSILINESKLLSVIDVSSAQQTVPTFVLSFYGNKIYGLKS
jgi:hypothetical protein